MDNLLRLITISVRVTEPIDSNTPLISSGLIDSFDVVILLSVFEDEYGVVIEPEEIDVNDFDTPRQMLARINANRG